MICQECAWEADVRQRVREGKRRSLPRLNIRLRKGHAACRGCDCQHRPHNNASTHERR